MNNFAEKAKNFTKKNMFAFLVVVACIAFLLRSYITIGQTGKTIPDIVADTVIGLIFAQSLSKMLGLQGLKDGEANEKVINTNNLHSTTVCSISSKIGELDGWCERKTEVERKSLQNKILRVGGIPIEEFTNYWSLGELPERYKSKELKELEKMDKPNEDKSYSKKETKLHIKLVKKSWKSVPREKRKAIKRAKTLRITPLTQNGLTAEEVNINDPLNLGDDKNKHIAKADAKRTITKIVTAFGFGYYGVKLVNSFSRESLIWTLIQLIIFLMLAFITYVQNFFYMTDTHRFRTIRKINYLEAFRNDMRLPAPVDTKPNNEIEEITNNGE